MIYKVYKQEHYTLRGWKEVKIAKNQRYSDWLTANQFRQEATRYDARGKVVPFSITYFRMKHYWNFLEWFPWFQKVENYYAFLTFDRPVYLTSSGILPSKNHEIMLTDEMMDDMEALEFARLRKRLYTFLNPRLIIP